MDKACHLQSCCQPGTLYLEAIDVYVCEDHLYIYLEAGNFSHIIGDGKPTDAGKIVKLLNTIRSVFEKTLNYAEIWYPKEMKEKELESLKQLESKFFKFEKRFEEATQDENDRELKRVERKLNSFIFKLQTSDPYIRYLTHKESVKIFSSVDQEEKIQKLMEDQTEEEKQAIDQVKAKYEEEIKRLKRKQKEEIKELKTKLSPNLEDAEKKIEELRKEKEVMEKEYEDMLKEKDHIIANLAQNKEEGESISTTPSTPITANTDLLYTPDKVANFFGLNDNIYDKVNRNLALNLCNPEHQEFIKGAKNFKFEGLENLYLTNLPPHDKHLEEFMSNSFTFVRMLYFNNGSSKIRVDRYLDALFILGRKTSTWFILHNLELDAQSISKCFDCGKHASDWFEFVGCRFHLETEPDFSEALDGFTFPKFNLDQSGLVVNSNWREHPESFVHLIRGISKAKDINKKLSLIRTTGTCMEKEFVRKVYDEAGMTEVILENHS